MYMGDIQTNNVITFTACNTMQVGFALCVCGYSHCNQEQQTPVCDLWMIYWFWLNNHYFALKI